MKKGYIIAIIIFLLIAITSVVLIVNNSSKDKPKASNETCSTNEIC